MADEGSLMGATTNNEVSSVSTLPAAVAAANIDGPGKDKGVQSESASPHVPKDKVKDTVKRIEKTQHGNDDSMQTLKRSIIVTGVILAVVGAAFAITKKIREK